MSSPQLKLIPRTENRVGNSSEHIAPTPAADPIRRVFDHWLFMSRRNPNRTKLGPQRRQVIAAALLLYSEEDLQLAIEGNLVEAWCVEQGRHDIDWLLVGESRIERFMALGDALRERADRQHAQALNPALDPAAPVVDPELRRAAMERLRQAMDEMRTSGGLRGPRG